MTSTAEAYTIRFDDAEETYKFEVIDADGDVLDCFETRKEANADVRSRLAEDKAEQDEEEAGGLRTLIAGRLEELTLADLNALAATLKLI